MALRHYMIICPGWVYAGDYYGTSKKAAIVEFKRINKVSRMPKGYAIWEKN